MNTDTTDQVLPSETQEKQAEQTPEPGATNPEAVEVDAKEVVETVGNSEDQEPAAVSPATDGDGEIQSLEASQQPSSESESSNKEVISDLQTPSDEEPPSSPDGDKVLSIGDNIVEESKDGQEKKEERKECNEVKDGAIKKEKADAGKKEVKKEGKKSKKGRDAEHMTKAVMQALNGLETPEEKIAALCKKYAELLGEHKALQREHKVQQKQISQLQRERDHLQSEHGRAILAKSKLESLCRELQRHNKTIKDESMQRAREEEEKRKEVSAKFQQTINEITTQMQDNHTRNLRLKEENLELASKLKKLVEQYERREEHIEKIFKHKELESQLYDAKLQQSNLALAEEKERNTHEKALLMSESADAQRKCELLSKQEAQLKAQLAVYTEKFEEFQSTLTKSNEIFQTFKVEMDQMTKKIKKLEKETNMWRVRWENSNKSLLNMAEEKTIRDKELADQRNKVTKLEKLCRALQAERNALLGKQRSLEGSELPKKTPNTIPIEDVPTDPDTTNKNKESDNDTAPQSQPEEKADTNKADNEEEHLVNGNDGFEENKGVGEEEEKREAGDGKDEDVEK